MMRNGFYKLATLTALALPLLAGTARAQHTSTYQNKTVPSLATQGLTSSFPASYDDSRRRFTEYFKKFEKKNISAQNLSAPIALEGKETLTIDGLYINGENPSKLLVVTSGIHGAEAFAGATLQDLFLQHLLSEEKPKVSVLLIHAVNPFGFKYFRRANPNNVDLNRNHADAEEFASANEAFERLVHSYTPETPASGGILPQTGFYVNVFLKYITAGKKVILNSLSGQYKYAKSIFYGGTALEKETVAVQDWINTFSKDKTHVLHIDLHTGFGEKGKLHFYGSDEFTSPDQIKNLNAIFPAATVDTGRDADFYPTKGDFVDWTWKSHRAQNVVPMVFEFGTLNSQTISGGLKSLWASVLENQGYHNGYGTKHDRRLIRRRFEELFNPQNKEWQQKVVDQGTRELLAAYENIGKL